MCSKTRLYLSRCRACCVNHPGLFLLSLRFHCLLRLSPTPPPSPLPLSSRWLNVFSLHFFFFLPPPLPPLRWRGLSALVTISLTVKSKPCHDWAEAGRSQRRDAADCLTITLGNSHRGLEKHTRRVRWLKRPFLCQKIMENLKKMTYYTI